MKKSTLHVIIFVIVILTFLIISGLFVGTIYLVQRRTRLKSNSINGKCPQTYENIIDELNENPDLKIEDFFVVHKFGNVEYECYGTCYCYEEDTEYNKRRKSAHSLPLQRLSLVVGAVTSLLAFSSAKSYFDQECEEMIGSECESIHTVHAEVENCEEIDKSDEIKSFDDTSTSNDNEEGGNENQKKKTLVIMRGLPGSGKSYLARELVKDLNPAEYRIFSSDEYFYNKEKKKYEFQFRRVDEAHAWNLRRAFRAIDDGIPYIIIDNTHAKAWHAKPYVKHAVEKGYEIEVMEPQTPWAKNPNECFYLNVHGVPFYRIQGMDEEWDEAFTVDDILKSQKDRRY